MSPSKNISWLSFNWQPSEIVDSKHTCFRQGSRAPLSVSAGSDLKRLRKYDVGATEDDGKQKRLKDTIKHTFLSSCTYVGRKTGVVCYHFNTIIWVPIHLIPFLKATLEIYNTF